MPGEPKHYTLEFREQAVKKAVGSSPPRTIAEVARELGINGTMLGFWVRAYRKKLAGQPRDGTTITRRCLFSCYRITQSVGRTGICY